MARNQVQKRRLSVESLESRQLLTGNVALKVIGGNLFMTGDDANNSVTLAGTATPGKYIVTGLASTKIDGKASETLTGITASVIVNLNGGNDTLEITKLKIGGDLNVNMGSGNNKLDITTAGPVNSLQNSVGGSVVVNSGSGNDVVIETSLSIGGSNVISTGGGLDKVELGDDPLDKLPGDPKPGKDCFVKTGGDLVVNLGDGAGSFFDADGLTLGGSLVAMHGSGKLGTDGIEVENSTMSGVLKITNSGGGTYSVEGDSATQLLFIDTGNGNDVFNLVGDSAAAKNSFKVAQILLGGGDDTLNVKNTTVSTVAVFDGGSGTNHYHDNGGTSLANLQKTNFS